MLRLVGKPQSTHSMTRRLVLSSPPSPSRMIQRPRQHQFSSSRGPPPAAKRAGYSIPAQGFVFTALLFPALAYAMYADRYGPSDEQLELDIRERYAARIAENRQKNEAMADLFQHAIRNPDGTLDDNLKEVLYAGKGGKKRFLAVDEKLYGTAEGVEEKSRQDEERKKREEYRRKKKAGEIVDEKPKDKKSKKTSNSPEAPPPPPSDGGGHVVNAQSAATLGAVAVLAAGVGYLAGGSRRS